MTAQYNLANELAPAEVNNVLAPRTRGGGPLLGRLAGVFRGEGRDFEQSRRLLSRSAVLAELPPPGASRTLLWLISFFVFGLLAWACLVQLDEVAAAPGEIAPLAQVQPVQHLEGGIISKIHVLDGQRVEKGDIIVTLDGVAVRAELERARARRTALALQAERLTAFSDGRAASFDSGSAAELRMGEAAILSGQRQSRSAQLSVAEAQSAVRKNELIAAREREASLGRQVELLRQDIEARKPLVENGIISGLAYLALERELSRLEGDLAATVADRRRAEAAVQEALRSSVEIHERLRADALQEYGVIAAQLAQAEQDVKRLEDQAARLEVRAPIAGLIKGLAAVSERQVVPAGGVIAELVPQAGELVATVRISPGDVGHVKIGSPVMVKVATYDYARNGGVQGTVSFVSAASFLDQDGRSYFKAQIALASNHVGPASRGFVVSPGMTVVADIKTGSKTLTEYLFKPVTNALNGAFSER